MAKKKASKKTAAAPATPALEPELKPQEAEEPEKKAATVNYETLVGERVDKARKIGLMVSVSRAFGGAGGLDLYMPGKVVGDQVRITGGMGAKDMASFLQGSVWGWRVAMQRVKDEAKAATKAGA